MEFTIKAKSGAGKILGTEEAATPELAATKFVRRRGRGSKNIFAQRVTGTHGLSGCFQAYTPIRGGGSTSRGDQFHVS